MLIAVDVLAAAVTAAPATVYARAGSEDLVGVSRLLGAGGAGSSSEKALS